MTKSLSLHIVVLAVVVVTGISAFASVASADVVRDRETWNFSDRRFVFTNVLGLLGSFTPTNIQSTGRGYNSVFVNIH